MLSESIKSRIAARFFAPLTEFHKRRIVFWRDEDGQYTEDIDELVFSNVKIVKLTGSNNFSVKKLLTYDDLTSDYLIYDPLSYEKDHNDDWLLDIRLYSEEFHADLVSSHMEELLVTPTADMRKTMKIYAKFLGNKERFEKLRKIGRTYQTPLQLHIDIMAVLCGLSGGSAQDVITAVLSAGLDKESNNAIDNITRFGNINAFWQLIQKFTGYNNAEDKPLSELAAHILLTALSQSIPPLKGFERFVSDSCKAYCYQLVHEWQRGDGRETLIEICRIVEEELRLIDRFDKIEMETLLKSDVFPAVNECLIARLFSEINTGVINIKSIFGMVLNRRTSAMYDLTEDYTESLYYIAKMQNFYLECIESFHISLPKKVWSFYTEKAFEMDSFYRHFHIHFGNTLKAPNPILEDALKKCTDKVEGLYREWYLSRLTDIWTKAIADDLSKLGYVSEINKQRDFYARYITSNKNNRTFVIISDALRYEVAAELSEVLGHETKGKASLEAVQAIFPGITKFGMAALLPGKEMSVDDEMKVYLNGKSTDSTIKRASILTDKDKNSIAVQYNDLLQMKKQERRSLVAGKDIIYIYHNAIDAIGDKAATETKVFDACDTAIKELIGLVKLIVNDLSGMNIYITADHGFLYTYKPLDESQKVSRQTFNGDVYELGRRYALVSPDTTADYLLPINTGNEIGEIAIKGYAPQDTTRIKVQGGGENYVHGGISLQEMTVPIIIYKGMRSDYKKYVEVKNPGFSLISESRKVSNLMFSLDFLQNQPIGEKIQPSTYSIQFTDETGLTVSDIQMVIADRTSANPGERVFRVRFTLKQMSYDPTKIYKLVIKNDTDIPEEAEFHFDIAFADDFGFDL
jgi:uncharacterized protein (TIGR02687 family)